MTAADSHTAQQSNETDPGSATAVLKIGKWFGLLIVVAIVGLPLWASVRYRLAVGGLHDELADVQPVSAELADSYVSSCFNDVAPASIRVFEPIGDAELRTVQSDYIDELAARGFARGSVGTESVWSRERSDDLDGDIVRFEFNESANTLTVIADTYDIDMVACIPLTGRR